MLMLNCEVKDVKPEDIKQLEEYINKQDTMIIATVSEVGPYLALVSDFKNYKLPEIYFATHSYSNKAKNIEVNGNVEIIFSDGNSEAICTGKAEFIEDKAIKDAMYRTEMDNNFKDGREDESYCLVKVVVSNIRSVIF